MGNNWFPAGHTLLIPCNCTTVNYHILEIQTGVYPEKYLNIPSTFFSFARPRVKPGNQLWALYIISALPKAVWSYLTRNDRGPECFISVLFSGQVKAL